MDKLVTVRIKAVEKPLELYLDEAGKPTVIVTRWQPPSEGVGERLVGRATARSAHPRCRQRAPQGHAIDFIGPNPRHALQQHDARLVARMWVKEIGAPLISPRPCTHPRYKGSSPTLGNILLGPTVLGSGIADAETRFKEMSGASHSIFVRKVVRLPRVTSGSLNHGPA